MDLVRSMVATTVRAEAMRARVTFAASAVNAAMHLELYVVVDNNNEGNGRPRGNWSRGARLSRLRAKFRFSERVGQFSRAPLLYSCACLETHN